RSAKGNVDYIRPEIVQPPQTDDLSGDHDLHYTRVRDLPKAANWKGAEGAPTKTSTPYDYSISIQKSQRSLETKVITRIEKGGFLDLGKLTIFTNSSVFEVEIYKENLGKDVYLELVMVRQGTFLMGSSNEESDRIDWEGPQRSVNVGSFLISQCVINQVQWNRVSALPKIDMDLNPDPSYFKGDRNPVEKVSWYEAYEFCNRLSQLTRRVYRLPSEAEWEYACRAGTRTPFYFGEIITPDLANFAGKHQRITTEVNQFFPNAFGLYGMHGNVLEWCADHWHENYVGAPNDGSAWLSDNKNAKRVARGGSWDVDPSYCRSARRSRYLPDVRQRTVGFRVICEQ
ncbi:formylglycine-generating enzyme family protein, partial [Aetokthonos hydrillicola]